MKKTRSVYKGMCFMLAAFILVPHGPVVAAATPARAENMVTHTELYDAMSARIEKDVAARESVQKVLGRSEVRRVAARAGLDVERAQAAVSVLSGAELQTVADQALRVDEALSGGSRIVVTSTAVIIALLVVILLVVA